MMLAFMALILQPFIEIAKMWFKGLRNSRSEISRIWHDNLCSPDFWKKLAKAAVTPPKYPTFKS
jgi:hypothetical protein